MPDTIQVSCSLLQHHARDLTQIVVPPPMQMGGWNTLHIRTSADVNFEINSLFNPISKDSKGGSID
jgi:hypothetical protein